VETLTVSNNSADTTAAQFVTQFNHDATVDSFFTASSSGATITITDKTAGPGENTHDAVTATDNSGTTLTAVTTTAAVGQPEIDTLTVTNQDTQSGELVIKDGTTVVGTYQLTGTVGVPETASEIASQIQTAGVTGFTATVATNVVTLTGTTDGVSHTLSVADYIAQVDTLDFTGVSTGTPGATFSDTIDGTTVTTDVLTGADAATIASAMATAISDANIDNGTGLITASATGDAVTVTTTDATTSFTDSGAT
jgi:hypothetical protein